jgi:hypothetical protein
MRGIRMPEESSLSVYVRIWTFGSVEASSCEAVVVLREEGVGAQVTLMTCWMPGRQIDSISSPLKKDIRIDFNWMKRGCVSKSSDAK